MTERQSDKIPPLNMCNRVKYGLPARLIKKVITNCFECYKIWQMSLFICEKSCLKYKIFKNSFFVNSNFKKWKFFSGSFFVYLIIKRNENKFQIFSFVVNLFSYRKD